MQPVTEKRDFPARLLDLAEQTAGLAQTALYRAVGRRFPYESLSWEAVALDLEDLLGGSSGTVEKVLSEDRLLETERHVRDLLEEIRAEDPFLRRWAADSVLARCCYLLCRLLRPSVVVETGVAYGVSSAFLLAALAENGRGELHSIDLVPPRRGARRFQGVAVPESLRGRWTLHRGASRRVLPPLLRSLRERGGVDLFVHDSLHSRANMEGEFALVWPELRRGGAVVADDVERNAAFGSLQRRKPALWRVVCDRETDPLHGPPASVAFGVAVKGRRDRRYNPDS
ncbi:Methyltransferase domain [Rubrobacter radiotolerans]|uniref:Class I SAM-dependent methyltransferase n=1 Tax=Rubrobacter radiotolerans TaxID=42256 RepID=A0A023X6D4_RUBRA|nr:class I SAM-dependent methyltransferase [Rubrobacter radiotolerans]AHY47604.1 Methyltransferase domain [Rubrobacter radiotolerans]MDX5895009.1 class I SAM-dependent methyltransferase [Rubrobacter radiotolerans]SMC07263.1 Predicted O-methyltransferase YrrM [Rubrobacter radiotolerans DSM 5868]